MQPMYQVPSGLDLLKSAPGGRHPDTGILFHAQGRIDIRPLQAKGYYHAVSRINVA